MSCGIGYWLSRTPIYDSSHEHDKTNVVHHHLHTHGDGSDHGHWHFGFPNITHAHAHHHGHLHHDQEMPQNLDQLVELGHLHLQDGIFVYWAKCNVEHSADNSIKLSIGFVAGVGQQVSPVSPDQRKVVAQLFRGNEQLDEIHLVWNKGAYRAEWPSKIKITGEETIEISRVSFGDFECLVKTPLVN